VYRALDGTCQTSEDVVCSWLANLQSKTFERTDSSHVEWRHSTSRLLRLQRRQFAQPLLSVRRLPMATDNQPLTNRPRHPEWNSWTVWKISFRSLARNMCIVHYPHHTQWRTPMFLAGLLKDIFFQTVRIIGVASFAHLGTYPTSNCLFLQVTSKLHKLWHSTSRIQ